MALPLAPSLPLTPIDAVLLGFTFADGVQTRTEANSTVCAFEVVTDASGAIVDWTVFLRQAPTPAPGDPQRTLEVCRRRMPMPTSSASRRRRRRLLATTSC